MSPSRLFTVILFLALFTMTVREISDPDFWWHLRTGQYIIEQAAIPHTDPFSFTAQGKEWITHEWLSEVFIYSVFRIGGYALLTLIFSGIITLAFALTYLRSEGRPYLAGFALILGALATAPTWDVRPQMISLLLTSVFLFLLDRYRVKRNIKWLIPLPLLMVVWVNLHAGYALGLVVVAIYLAGDLIESFVARVRQGQGSGDEIGTGESGLSVRAISALLVVLVLSVLAVLLNPNGARMYVYPFETLTSPAMQRYIQEWFSPDLHQIEWLPFALLLLGTLGGALIARAKIPLAHTLLLLALALASLRSVRNIPLFAIVAVPVLSAQLAAFIPLRATNRPTPRMMHVINVVLCVVIALVALVRVGMVLGNQANIESTKFPQAAVAWIEQNHPTGNLYNSYGWGGYLIWKLYPDYRVYIDGRADVYGDTFIERFLDVYRGSPGWEEELTRKDVRLVLIEPDAPLATALSESPQWAKVFADKQSVIFQQK